MSSGGKELPAPEGKKLKLTVRDHTPLGEIYKNMTGANRSRSILSLVLMIGQSFFFNAVFFTYGLVGKKFFHLSDKQLPLQLLPFAIASFLGPVVLGKLFDKIGRKPMITATYALAGCLLGAICIPFAHGTLGLRGMAISFSVIFFVASSAASAAYLNGQRDLPARDPLVRYRNLLRARNTDWWRGCAAALRHTDPHRIKTEGCTGLWTWSSAYGCRSGLRVLHRSRGRRAVAGECLQAVAKPGVTASGTQPLCARYTVTPFVSLARNGIASPSPARADRWRTSPVRSCSHRSSSTSH